MKKNTYIIIIIIILTILLRLIGNYYQFEVKWYYYLGLIFFSNIIGSLFYVFFSGVNISNIEFLNNSNKPQEFKCDYQLGFSEIKSIKGLFENEFNLNESELRNILYQQTEKKDIKVLEFINEKEITYTYKNKKFAILFKK